MTPWRTAAAPVRFPKKEGAAPLRRAAPDRPEVRSARRPVQDSRGPGDRGARVGTPPHQLHRAVVKRIGHLDQSERGLVRDPEVCSGLGAAVMPGPEGPGPDRDLLVSDQLGGGASFGDRLVEARQLLTPGPEQQIGAELDY